MAGAPGSMDTPAPNDIDAKKVRLLTGMGLTVEEVAAVLDCSKRTLERRFGADLRSGRTRLHASIKRKQFALAMKGNVSMCIWLGKQHLGQGEKADPAAKGPKADAPVIVIPDNGRDSQDEIPAAADD